MGQLLILGALFPAPRPLRRLLFTIHDLLFTSLCTHSSVG